MTTKTDRQITTLTQLATNYRRLASETTDPSMIAYYTGRANRYAGMIADPSTYQPLVTAEMIRRPS